MHRRILTATLALIMALTLAAPDALAAAALRKPRQAAPISTPSSDRKRAAASAEAAGRPSEKPVPQPTATFKAASAEKLSPAVTQEPAYEAIATPIPTMAPTPAPTPLLIQLDDQGEAVKSVQERLRTLGFLTDQADGYFGPLTLDGVKRFQKFAAEYMAIELHRGEAEPSDAGIPKEQGVPAAAPVPSASAAPEPEASPAPKASSQPTAAVPTSVPTAIPTAAPTSELAPYIADGIVDNALYDFLSGDTFKIYYSDLEKGAHGLDVKRLQTRLANLYYLTDGTDGIFGGNTAAALSYFQKHNGLEATGVADRFTQEKLYSAAAVPTQKPLLEAANKHSKGNGKSYDKYKLVIDVSDQRVYAYGYENGAYGPLARAMVCSTGTKSSPTPIGTFKGDGPSHRWHYFKKFECYAQYSWRIDGPILFHSVLFRYEDEDSLVSSSVRNLGRRASHGCVRLSVKDAKWIFNNCKSGTTVVVRE